MLKGISPLFSPELLATLYQMGHGDEIVLADAHFPGHSVHNHVIRADGLGIDALLAAILPLFVLDQYSDQSAAMMACVPGDEPDPTVSEGYQTLIDAHSSETAVIHFEERFDFYKRATAAFAVVMTGDTRQYANLILKKGVTPLPE